MLGTRVNSFEEAFEIVGKPAFADFKYDGLRVQIHNYKGKVKLFSRNLEDITTQFPEIINFIKQNFSDLSFILDSECVGYDYKNKKFLPFQTLSKRIMKKEINENLHINITVKIFDILYLKDETLIKKPYKERREILENLFLNRKIIQNKIN
jgi:DNA ligase-1